MTGNRPFMTQRKELAAAEVWQLNRGELPAHKVSNRTGSSHRVRGVDPHAMNHGDELSSICGGSYCNTVSNALARRPGHDGITGDVNLTVLCRRSQADAILCGSYSPP